MPFPRVLFALGIRYVGETVAKKLALHFGSIDRLMQADFETLIEVNEIGERIAESLLDYFKKPANIHLIQRLKDHHLKFEMEQVDDNAGTGKLNGAAIVVSGVFKNFSRDELKALIDHFTISLIKCYHEKDITRFYCSDRCGLHHHR